ncbi:HDOD domain-containing protein [Alteromonadaceae bacterium M269]|nr:HDOD domain-containing protein [Alteromonadaceae bacterium M269]
MSTENALLTILVEKINNDTLVLPTLPAVALKVRKAADDPDVNLNALADVIGQDPSLTARMIKISNSAYLGRTVKVETLNQAVTRIGLRQVKNVATALAMEQLFVSKNEVVKEQMTAMWEATVDVVANAMAAMQTYTDRTKDRSLNLETLTLAALVHNIGVLPILTEAERHEDVFANTTFLEAAIHKLSGRIGSAIMKAWGFGEDFAALCENWRNLTHQEDKVGYMDFVRVGAALAGQMNDQKSTILNVAQKAGLFENVSELESDQFATYRSSAKDIFE